MAPTSNRAATAPPPLKQATNGTAETSSGAASSGDVTVNKKKQKRRQKQAARLAAEQPSRAGLGSTQACAENGQKPARGALLDHGGTRLDAQIEELDSDTEEQYEPQDGAFYDSEEDQRLAYDAQANDPNAKSKKKRKNKSRSESQPEHGAVQPLKSSISNTLNAPPPPPPPPPLSTNNSRSGHKSKDRIWNTSTQEERERIKEFWLSLEEKERRSLVKVEKEAVLKKMKEQQKHSCSCTVCGRKRTAIEEELEVLYDTYYKELEQYANHQQIDGTPIMPSRAMYHPMSKFGNRVPPQLNSKPSRGRIQEVHEVLEDEDELEEDDDSYDEDDDDDYSEEPEEEPRGPAADFFNFGNSLTVQGGILTVADDLLKNDGKKFIEMMEQLAERRMQREEEASYAARGASNHTVPGHTHGPPVEDDEYDDDEDDDEYDSQDEEDYEGDEMETMTEEQRMEEGRRMFQIFAARMFEQRVLTAYREKVARERQERLLEELADETRQDAQREAKKAKEAQKKKDKKKQQKQAKDEEKARRDAEKAAEEAATKAIEEQKLEEQRQKKEEQRKKKEAEKKAQEEERQRKEAERQRKLQDARELQAEAERKQREQKEREKKKREEQKKKEREEREAKERDAKEKKERELAERKEKEAKAKAEKDAKERARKEEMSAKIAAHPIAPIAVPPLLRKSTSTAVPLPPPGLSTPHQQPQSSHASPHLQVATPVIPKAPTPIRPRQASFQESHNSSPKVSTAQSGSSTTSPGSASLQHTGTAPLPIPGKMANPPVSAHPLPPFNAPLSGPPGLSPHHPSQSGSPLGSGGNFPMHYVPMVPPGMPRPLPGQEQMYGQGHPPFFNATQYRSNAPSGLPFVPGMNGIRQMPQGRNVSSDMSPHQIPPTSGPIGSPALSYQHPIGHSGLTSHSRNASASMEKSAFEPSAFQPQTQTQPIARPAPIKRPSSIPRQGEEEGRRSQPEIDDLSSHLGSSALLDDSDENLAPNTHDRQAPMPPRTGRLGFGASPMFPDPVGSAKMDNFNRGGQPGPGNTWGAPPMPFGTPTLPNLQTWSNAPGGPPWPNNNAFGIIGGPNRSGASRPVIIRLLVSQACRQLAANNSNANGGFNEVNVVLRQVENIKPPHEAPIQLTDILDIVDTEGNAQNGGGAFHVHNEGQRGMYIKFEPNEGSSMARAVGMAGEIGSPVVGHNFPFGGSQRPFQQGGGGPITSPSNF
ncbi:MAG: Stress response protein nst1 [Icmadophila ericetorum]|nr:Stress response protein nst1 [Icmadophila ericetorum]